MSSGKKACKPTAARKWTPNEPESPQINHKNSFCLRHQETVFLFCSRQQFLSILFVSDQHLLRGFLGDLIKFFGIPLKILREFVQVLVLLKVFFCYRRNVQTVELCVIAGIALNLSHNIMLNLRIILKHFLLFIIIGFYFITSLYLIQFYLHSLALLAFSFTWEWFHFNEVFIGLQRPEQQSI